MFVRNLKLALFLLVAIPIRLSATTVVVIVANNGMVISSDSMTTNRDAHYSAASAFDQAKFVTIQQRIVVAAIGVSAFKDANHEFNFLTWMSDLQKRIPKDATVDDVASTVEKESIAAFYKAGIDTYVKSGALERQHYDNVCEKFTEFVIAGYQGGKPRLYSVKIDVDWNKKSLSAPVSTIENPDSEPADYRVVSFGTHEAITDYTNEKSYAHQMAITLCPEAIKKIDKRTTLPSFDETVALSRVFIQVEENTNPDDVGGAINTVTWLPDGHAQEWTEHEASPPKL